MTSAVGRAKATKSDPSIVCATGRGRSLGSKAVSIRRPRQLERASSLRQNDQSINSRDTVAGIEPGTTYRYTLKPTRAHTHSYTTSAMGRTATHSNQKQKQKKKPNPTASVYLHCTPCVLILSPRKCSVHSSEVDDTELFT